MSTTQSHLSIFDIKDDIVLLKDGGGALILQVSAVNFGLLSDREQIAIISAFAQMLNSLSFSIQIVIYSERLNIESYLTLLDKAEKAQTNPLLSKMIDQYRRFIQNTIKENEVLDKQFFIAIPLFRLELGLSVSSETLNQKIKTILLPRRDQIIRQLNRVGLKANQLTNPKLIELFYDIYNRQVSEKISDQIVNPQAIEVKLKSPKPLAVQPTYDTASNTQAPDQGVNPPDAQISTQASKNHPFVVEELNDNS